METIKLLEAFPEFWQGYIEALAFTASDGTDEGNNPFDPGPGEFTENVPLERIVEVLNQLDLAEQTELATDCLDFLSTALPLIGDNLHSAGSDFHFSRNGHGAGFFDSDQYDGNEQELQSMAETYGTLELEFSDDLPAYLIH